MRCRSRRHIRRDPRVRLGSAAPASSCRRLAARGPPSPAAAPFSPRASVRGPWHAARARAHGAARAPVSPAVAGARRSRRSSPAICDGQNMSTPPLELPRAAAAPAAPARAAAAHLVVVSSSYFQHAAYATRGDGRANRACAQRSPLARRTHAAPSHSQEAAPRLGTAKVPVTNPHSAARPAAGRARDRYHQQSERAG